MNSCEMIGCGFWNGKNCTDTDPLYRNICRYNDYWKTEEGLARIEEYNSKERPMADNRNALAELAKVKDIKEFGVVHVREDMAIDAVEKCRAIAEEGAES